MNDDLESIWKQMSGPLVVVRSQNFRGGTCENPEKHQSVAAVLAHIRTKHLPYASLEFTARPICSAFKVLKVSLGKPRINK
jgi:hypothetical protein